MAAASPSAKQREAHHEAEAQDDRQARPVQADAGASEGNRQGQGEVLTMIGKLFTSGFSILVGLNDSFVIRRADVNNGDFIAFSSIGDLMAFLEAERAAFDTGNKMTPAGLGIIGPISGGGYRGAPSKAAGGE